MPIDPNPLAHLWEWVEIHTGSQDESKAYYGFFSGFGSDLTEIAVIGGLIQLIRHHNCHVKRCLRLGRKVDGTPYVACPAHHPDHKGTTRNVSHAEITRAHAAAQNDCV